MRYLGCATPIQFTAVALGNRRLTYATPDWPSGRSAQTKGDAPGAQTIGDMEGQIDPRPRPGWPLDARLEPASPYSLWLLFGL